jgi:cytochrome P450
MITDLAYPLPSTVIAEMLGVPTSDRAMFKRWADTLFDHQISDAELFKSSDPSKLPGFQESDKVMEEMAEYFEGMMDERKQRPREDMMSNLLAAEVDGEKLTTEQFTSFCILLLLAGHVTTTNLIGQAVLCFDEYPETMQQLRKQPELMPGAIEEILRYASPVWRLVRTTREKVEMGDVTFPEQAIIFAWLASANRDSAQFPEPERFDITRTPNRQIDFGHGIHFCLGAPLARLEASIALPMMLEQLPELRRVREIPLECIGGLSLNGVKHLPVTFAPTPILQKTGSSR